MTRNQKAIEDLMKLTRINLLDKEDELNRDYWKLEVKKKEAYRKVRDTKRVFDSLNQRASDKKALILNIREEFDRRDNKK